MENKDGWKKKLAENVASLFASSNPSDEVSDEDLGVDGFTGILSLDELLNEAKKSGFQANYSPDQPRFPR